MRWVCKGLKILVSLGKKIWYKLNKAIKLVKEKFVMLLTKRMNPNLYKKHPALYLLDVAYIFIGSFFRFGSKIAITGLAVLGILKVKTDEMVYPILTGLAFVGMFIVGYVQLTLWLCIDVILTALVVMEPE